MSSFFFVVFIAFYTDITSEMREIDHLKMHYHTFEELCKVSHHYCVLAASGILKATSFSSFITQSKVLNFYKQLLKNV